MRYKNVLFIKECIKPMKKINYLKYAEYMRRTIETKYPTHSVVWVGENNFIIVKEGKEIRVKYE